MAITYYKRFRMEIDLQSALAPVPALPDGYAWIAWEDWLVEQHAEVKYQCFIEEIDAVVFTSLSNRDGCRRLMRDIAGKPGFKPEATWLMVARVKSPPPAPIASTGMLSLRAATRAVMSSPSWSMDW